MKDAIWLFGTLLLAVVGYGIAALGTTDDGPKGDRQLTVGIGMVLSSVAFSVLGAILTAVWLR